VQLVANIRRTWVFKLGSTVLGEFVRNSCVNHLETLILLLSLILSDFTFAYFSAYSKCKRHKIILRLG